MRIHAHSLNLRMIDVCYHTEILFSFPASIRKITLTRELMYTCIVIHICMYIYVCNCMYICVYVGVRAYVCICICMCVNACMHIFLDAYAVIRMVLVL